MNMKKYMKALCIAVALCVASQAQAIDFNWGVKGGMNFSGSSYKGLKENLNVKSNKGFFVGPMVELGLPLGFSVDGSVLYMQRNTEFIDDQTKETTNYYRRSIDIPLYAKFTFNPIKIFGVYAGVGPSFTFDIHNDNLTKKLLNLVDKSDDKTGKTRLIDNKAQTGLNFMLGVVIFKHLSAGINYRVPLGGTVKETAKDGLNDILTDNFVSKDKMWQVVLSLTF